MKEQGRIILQTENIIKQYKQYDTTVTAVNRANLTVHEGEFVSIIGSSGSGKSTFLHICAGLDKPNSGRVSIRNNEITAMSNDELAAFRDMMFYRRSGARYLSATLESIRIANEAYRMTGALKHMNVEYMK